MVEVSKLQNLLCLRRYNEESEDANISTLGTEFLHRWFGEGITNNDTSLLGYEGKAVLNGKGNSSQFCE